MRFDNAREHVLTIGPRVTSEIGDAEAGRVNPPVLSDAACETVQPRNRPVG